MEIDVETPQFNIETTTSATSFDITVVPGAAATVAVGEVTTGAAGSQASVSNSGSPSAAVLDFTIPRGDTGTIAVGTVSTGAAGSSATVTNSGTSGEAVLNFTIPQGLPGSATISGITATELSRMVCKTTGGANGTDNWAKLATLSGSAGDVNLVLLAVTSSGNYQEAAVLSVGIRISGASITASVAMLSKTQKPGATPYLLDNAFKLVTDAVGSDATLWVKKNGTYGQLTVYELARNVYQTWGITYNNNAAWQAAEPTGTTNNIFSDGVYASGAPVVTTTATQSLSNKTLVSPTITGSPVTPFADAATTTAGSKHIYQPLNPDPLIGGGFVAGIHNDLAYLVERGGSVTATLNGSDITSSVSASQLFRNQTVFLSPSATNDVFVFTVTLPSGATSNLAYVAGLQFVQNRSRDVTIEAFISSAWTTIYTATNDAGSFHWVRHVPAAGPTQLRFTFTNHVGTGSSSVRLGSMFLITRDNIGGFQTPHFILPRGGGNVYGTNAAPFALNAAGSDSNIGINLIPKGTGTVQANGVPVVTTTGTQSLSNKTLTSPTITDSNGNTALNVTTAANAVNYPSVQNAAAGGLPTIRALGSDTDIGLAVRSKGKGSVRVTDGDGATMSVFTPTSVTPVNFMSVFSSGTGNPVTVAAAGSDSNVSLDLTSKGTGTVQANGVPVVTTTAAQTLTNKVLTSPRVNQILDTSGNVSLALGAIASAVNYLYIGNNAAGAHPDIYAQGSDTNISINLVPKGSGALRLFGSAPTLAAIGTDASLNLASSGTGTVKANGVDVVTTTGTQTLSNKTVSNPTITNYTESVVAIGTVTSSYTLSIASGTVLTATLTASTACTFTMPTAAAGKSFVLFLKQAATTGNGTATFTGVKWNAVGAPTITATAAKMDILSFFSDGTNWYGSYTQGYTP